VVARATDAERINAARPSPASSDAASAHAESKWTIEPDRGPWRRRLALLCSSVSVGNVVVVGEAFRF
jgi:hypothetical protein